MNMEKFEVGQLLQEGVTKYEECVKFGFSQAGADMTVFFNRPTNNEIEAVKTGKLEIAFYEKEGIIFFLSKFQGLNWMDSPYNVHLSQPYDFEDIPSDMGLSLTILLTDASTGIIKTIRYVGLGNKFSLDLQAAILKQKELQLQGELYYKKLQKVYANYSTSDLVKRASHFYKVK